MLVAQYYCPFDGPYGQIGFRLCSDGKTIVLMCDECDAIWEHPDHLKAENYISAEPPDFYLPDIKCSVKAPLSRWATREEVIKSGWQNFIIGENTTE